MKICHPDHGRIDRINLISECTRCKLANGKRCLFHISHPRLVLDVHRSCFKFYQDAHFFHKRRWVIFICHLEKVEFEILNHFKEGLNLRRDVFAYLNKLGGRKLCRVGISAIACSHEFWIK